MSIAALIQDRVGRGMLFPLVPKAAGTSARRAMFVAENLWHFLQTEHDDPEIEDRIGRLIADLEVFASGEDIYPKYLFLLYPAREAVWEIRSTRPDPSIRVLGRFAEKDVFVATNYALRSDLGAWQSRAWRDVKLHSATIWNQTLHPYRPIVSTDVNDVVSGAIDGKYFKTSD